MNFTVVYLLLATPLLKILLSHLRWGIRINKSKKQLIFQNAITKSVIKIKYIKEWGYRTLDDMPSKSSRYFECKLTNGKTFIYPVRMGSRSLKVSPSQLREIIGKAPKEYPKYFGLQRELKQPKYGLWILYSI